MELAEIVSSEKIDNKKVKEEIEKRKYNEDMLDVVSDESGGSAWDKVRFQGKGRKMKVHDRHNQMLSSKWEKEYIHTFSIRKQLQCHTLSRKKFLLT